MLHYDRIDISKGIDLAIVKNIWFATIGVLIMDASFKIMYVMAVMIWCLNISDITIVTVKNVDYRCIIYNISKYEAISLLENSVLEDRGYLLIILP